MTHSQPQNEPELTPKDFESQIRKSFANSVSVYWSTRCGGNQLPDKKSDYPETITLCRSHVLKLLERCPTSPQVFQPQSRTCGPWGLQTPPASASDCTHMKDPNKQKLPVWTHQPPEPCETMINHRCKSLHFGLVFTLQCINSDHASTPTGFSSMCFLVNNHCVSLDINYPCLNVQSACCFFPSIHTGNSNNIYFI